MSLVVIQSDYDSYYRHWPLRWLRLKSLSPLAIFCRNIEITSPACVIDTKHP
jgi:hypothetical protein